jgi:DNA-binding NarL/FixJ family response regulator
MKRRAISRTAPSATLTKREVEILRLLANGWSNARIAGKLKITTRTVKFHTTNIYEKINVRSRTAAVAWAWRNRKKSGVS